MLSVGEGQHRIIDRVSVLDPLELTIADAHGCVLAETVTAPEDLPPFASAAVDGFAIRSSDTTNAAQSAVSLTIIGEAAAGRPFAGRVTHGEAVRISGGASLPDGTDTVARKDDVAVVGSSMAIGKAIGANENIRPAGEDVAKGDPVMQDGQRIRGMDVGVLAALGRTRALVRPRPRLVIFSIGEQESNAFAMSGMAREAGSEPTRGGPVDLSGDALKEKFRSFLPQADVFLTTGGLSEDDGAVIRTAGDGLGNVDVWPISTSPEMTVAFGAIQGRPLFALPENPVAATLCFELFVRPALLKMAGRQTLYRPQAEGALEDGYEHRAGRETYLRVRAWIDNGVWKARLAGRQGPSVISSVAGANAIAVIGADKGSINPGETVKLILLEPLEGW